MMLTITYVALIVNILTLLSFLLSSSLSSLSSLSSSSPPFSFPSAHRFHHYYKVIYLLWSFSWANRSSTLDKFLNVNAKCREVGGGGNVPEVVSRWTACKIQVRFRTAGIPCMTVRGKAKAVGYQLGDKSSCAGGLWTIVCIDNNWRFVHPHWALTCSINFNDGRWTLVEEAGRAVRQR